MAKLRLKGDTNKKLKKTGKWLMSLLWILNNKCRKESDNLQMFDLKKPCPEHFQ